MLSAQHHRAAVDTLRALTARHPFDAAAWYQLGAAYFHVGRRVLITPDDYRRALSRAVELDPAQVLPYLHLIEDAFAREDEGKDYDAMLALWAADASATAFGNTYEGPVAIADFFETSGPFVNGWAALVPSYRTQIQVQGNRATFAFECVYVPDTGNLAGQTVVAHLNASGTAVKVGNRWLFEEFVGGIGPLP